MHTGVYSQPPKGRDVDARRTLREEIERTGRNPCLSGHTTTCDKRPVLDYIVYPNYLHSIRYTENSFSITESPKPPLARIFSLAGEKRSITHS